MTQNELADQLGVTFQQVQKYEGGSNRVSASRLANLAAALEVPPSFFFDEAIVSPAPPPVAEDRGVADELQEAWELLRCFLAVKDAESRKKVLALVKAVAAIR